MGVALKDILVDLTGRTAALYRFHQLVISSASVAFLSSVDFWPVMIINLRSRHMTQHHCSGIYYRKKINQEMRSEVQINKEHHIERSVGHLCDWTRLKWFISDMCRCFVMYFRLLCWNWSTITFKFYKWRSKIS